MQYDGSLAAVHSVAFINFLAVVSQLLKGENHVKRSSLTIAPTLQKHLKRTPFPADFQGYLAALRFFADLVTHACVSDLPFPHRLWEEGASSTSSNETSITKLLGLIAQGHRVTGFVREIESRPGLRVCVFAQDGSLLTKMIFIFWHNGAVASLRVEYPWVSNIPNQ